MAFKDLKKEDLVWAADYFGSDTDGTKDEIIEQLQDDGVTWEMYEQLVADNKPQSDEPDVIPVKDVTPDVPLVDEPADGPAVDTPVEKPEKVLIKMLTNNAIYERAGVRFTRAHPFKLVGRRQADVILQSEDFREATPQEAQEYYS